MANMSSNANATLPAQSPLLSLPGELRRAIYDYMTPLDGHISAYRGLTLACKQTHEEVQAQVLDQINKILQDVEMQWAKFSGTSLRISKPATLADLKEIVVSLPNSFFRDNVRAGSCWHTNPIILFSRSVPVGPLSKLLDLHIPTLKLTIFENETDGQISRNFKWSLRNLLTEIRYLIRGREGIDYLYKPDRDPHCFRPANLGSLNADALVFEWGDMGKHQVEEILRNLNTHPISCGDLYWWRAKFYTIAGETFKASDCGTWDGFFYNHDIPITAGGVSWDKVEWQYGPPSSKKVLTKDIR